MIEDRKSIARQCLRLLLRAVVRFCLKNSLAIQEVVEELKTVFVEQARSEITRTNKKASVSKISVVTGLQRRDVLRLTKSEARAEPPLSLASRVIGQWEQDARFRSASGAPRVLAYEGEHNEFKQLVASVSQDLNYCTILFELERVGAVSKTKTGVKLNRKTLDLKDDAAQGLQLLAQDSDDLMTSVLENLFHRAEIPQLHARTEYDNVAVEALPELRAKILQEGAEFHRRMRDYLSQFDHDINPAQKGRAGARVVIGTFGRVSEDRK